MSAVAYIIPGFRERAYSKAYRNVAAGFKKRKIRPVLISIRWQYATMTDYLNQFKQQLVHPVREIYLFGFSFGAMIALAAAAQLKPEKLFLCSLSPFFREDLPALSVTSRKSLGIKRLRDFSNYSLSEMAKKIKCKTFLFIGELELPSVIDRSLVASKTIRNSSIVIVKDGNHNIGHVNYQREILKIISQRP